MTTPTVERNAHINTTRNATFDSLMETLQQQQARKIDMIIPAEKIKFREGQLVIAGQDMILEDDGFTDPNANYLPTQVFDDQLAGKLALPTSVLRQFRNGRFAKGNEVYPPRLDLYDANANGLLLGRKPLTRLIDGEQVTIREAIGPDSRSFFVRLIRPENGIGVARALLSNRFARLDNIDGLMAMLKGIEDAGINPSTLRIAGDLSEKRMYVHVDAPEILTAAPTLLDNYRSPFTSEAEAGKRKTRSITNDERLRLGQLWREQGRRGLGSDRPHGFYRPGEEPIVHAGFLLTNSEVCAGRWRISPEITILACSNGLTFSKDGFARHHVGATQDDGHVEWSEDTQSKELSLVTAQTRDVVKAVLSRDYLDKKVAELESKSGTPVDKPDKTIEIVGKRLAFTKEEQDGILAHFYMGGQMTSGGVMNAVTSYSQTVEDVDAAHELNDRAVDAMYLTAATS